MLGGIKQMFGPSKWDLWWDNLSPHTKTFLQNQPTWHGRDLVHAGIIGTIFGFIVGIVVGTVLMS